MNRILLIICVCFNCVISKAQQVVAFTDKTDQHIFGYKEIEYLEDRNGSLSLSKILEAPNKFLFTPSKFSTPQNYHVESAYWYKIKIKFPLQTSKNWLLEFFDQTIDDLDVFLPNHDGGYSDIKLGSDFVFKNRIYKHKNFVLDLKPDRGSSQVVYIRIKSHETADVIVVLRSANWFVTYALNEYVLFGVFYGMILVFAFYNFLMLLAIRQKQYLYYILYIISVGFYQACVDGLSYQYLWPNCPHWNKFAYGIALFGLSVCALLYTSKLLDLRNTAPRLYQILNSIIICRVIYFCVCVFYNKELFEYKFIEAIPLLVAFYAGFYTWLKGYRPARFFVIGYGFIFLGFLIKILIMLDVEWLLTGALGYYSLNICFVLEMVFLGFAMGDKVRILKKEKQQAQEERIEEFIINEQLKDTLNNKLEQQVAERTFEVVEKAAIIEQKNDELSRVNLLLQTQAEEISRINVLLEHDNIELKSSVEKVTKARIMSADVDFEEFSKIYPDRDSCYEYLADLKWRNGYICKKCDNGEFFHGHTPHSRRCRKCDYDESVTAYTIFANSRIPITKAFYMIFLIYSSKGKLSSHKLSEILTIRQSTCWAYSNKIKQLLANKKQNKLKGSQGWSSIVLDSSEKPMPS